MSNVVAMKRGRKKTEAADAQWEVVTPETAEAWLKTMRTNRPLNDARVVQYALSMDNEQWSANGETIKFDKDGCLFDGQHRLHACSLAGKPFRTMVVRGVDDPAAFATVDSGRSRTMGDVLGVSGHANQNVMAAAALIVYYAKTKQLTVTGPKGASVKGHIKRLVKDSQFTGVHARVEPPKMDLLKFIEPYAEKLHDSIKFVQRAGGHKIAPITQLAACHFLFAEKSRESADRFIASLVEGAGLAKDDPILVLRERLLASKMSTTKLTRWAAMLLMWKAWNYMRSAQRVKRILIMDGEEYPKLL